MYSIAKLLSDEPKKLESLILAILKLLATVWFAQLLLGFKTNLSEFTVDSFFKNFKVDESIYFVLTSIGIWYLLWEIIIDLGIDFFISLISMIGNPEKTLSWYLRVTYSVRTENDHIIDSRQNILYLAEPNVELFPFTIQSRANQIFSIGLISLIILLNSKIDLKGWQIALLIFAIINFFIVSVVQRKLHDYYNENSDHIKTLYYPFVQLQRVKNAVDQFKSLKKFKRNVTKRRILLSKTGQITSLPDEIIILPLYHRNVALGKKAALQEKNKIFKKEYENKLIVICSNFYREDQRLNKISDLIYCIYGESQEEIYKGFEELLYILRKSNSKNPEIKSIEFPKF